MFKNNEENMHASGKTKAFSHKILIAREKCNIDWLSSHFA
jgi:hypothetical protein